MRGRRRSTTVDRLVWYDQDGRRYEESRRMLAPGSLGAIPRGQRLVDVHCRADHFIAALVRNAGSDPLLYVPRVKGAVPAFVLVDDLLAVAFVSAAGVPVPTVGPVGTPRASFPIWCAECRRDFDLSAADLQAKRTPQPTARVPCLHVD